MRWMRGMRREREEGKGIRTREESGEGASSPFHSESGTHDGCQGTAGWSLDGTPIPPINLFYSENLSKEMLL